MIFDSFVFFFTGLFLASVNASKSAKPGSSVIFHPKTSEVKDAASIFETLIANAGLDFENIFSRHPDGKFNIPLIPNVIDIAHAISNLDSVTQIVSSLTYFPIPRMFISQVPSFLDKVRYKLTSVHAY